MRDSDGDRGGTPARRPVLRAEMLGLAMARRAADILDRHRDMLTRAAPADPAAFAADDAIFTAVLDAASECLGRVDSRPADDRWCDALLQLLQLARFAG
jgi:cytochrome P450